MSNNNSSAIELPAIDDLDRAIANLSARMDAACYEQLVLIRQFDERGGWLKWAFPNCTEWLAWRCDLGMNAAREKVRVAHALMTLPGIASAFAKGRLSYTKVRALTRVANPKNEKSLVAHARKNTAVRVEERCREFRCGTADSIDDANNAHSSRSLTIRRNPSRGTMTITVELPIETGELVVFDNDEQPLSVGRKTRIVPRAIKRALWARDKGCSFPGCHLKRFVDAHHIHHWSAGGETKLENLVLLCSRHHGLVHEGGYRMLKNYQDEWCFKRPDGIAVPECGYSQSDTIDEDVNILSTMVNNPSAEGSLINAENSDIDSQRSRTNGCFHR